MAPRSVSLGLRGRLMVSVLGAVTLVLIALTAAFNLVLAQRLDGDAGSVAAARASAELAGLRIAANRILLPEAPDDRALDSRTWIFEGARALERPRGDARNDRAAVALAGGPRRYRDVPGTSTRLYAVPVARAGRRLGTVVAGVSLEPYAQTRRTVLFWSVVLALASLLAAWLGARWLIARALRPVARMTAQAADWSERDLDRRFALGTPHDEFTRLAATLDGLLERVANSLRREQRLSAELSHELRTPLAGVIAETQYALRHAETPQDHRAGFERVLESGRRMERTLDTLMAAARAELDGRRATSDAGACAHTALAGCAGAAARRGLELEAIEPPAPLRVAVEADLVERMLAPLLDNACRYARHSVHVSIARAGTAVLFTVQDDGPGVDPAEHEAIFEPGHRGTGGGATALATHGAGLGLALARRLARAGGGEIAVGEAPARGAHFVLRLPLA